MLTFGPRVDGYWDVEDQLIDYLRRRAERGFRRREREREGIRTLEAFEKYRARMKENFLRAIGGLPSERTPLEASVNGTLDRGAYVIEKLIYHSLPEFPVTANLYVPKARRSAGPGPAVLFVCGHAEEAKAYPQYQKVCIELARDGFVVLAVDPPGQGERFQFIDERSGEQRVHWGTAEHTYAGLPFYMLGASIARHFVWDGIRGVDYLCARPEVDPKKIGVTGNSGGGTQSVYLMMSEPRLAAAMPCTFVMDYENYLKSGQPQDAEQNLHASFLDGPDHDDYITAMAPKPVRLGLAAYDFFPIEGALAAFEKARNFYALFGAGAPEKLDYAVAPTTHNYSPQLRQAAVNFFRKHLRGDTENFVTAEPETLPRAQLHATPTGQVLSSFPGGRTICDVRREEARRVLPPSPRKIEPEALRRSVAEALGIGSEVPEGEACWEGEPRRRAIRPRIIAEAVVNGYRSEKIFFFTEADITATAILMHPRGESKARGTEVLLLPDGTRAIPDERARIVGRLEQGQRVCVYDVRGVGAVRTRGAGRRGDVHGTEWKLGCDAMKIKTSTLGLRVFDVLRGYDYLQTRPEAGPVSLTGVGVAAAWALYAAVLEPGIAGLNLEGAPLSYRAAVEARFYDTSAINFRSVAWGMLRAGDLVELLATIAPRPLTITRPRSPQGLPLDAERVEAEFMQPAEAAGLIGEKADGWRPAIRGV